MRWLKLLLAWLAHLIAPRPACVSRPPAHDLPAPVAAPDLSRYEDAIRAYEEKDQLHPPAPGGTVFAGSSTFTLWSGLEETFADFQALNRGFGGSTIPEVEHYAPRVVLKYRPRRIVFYAGTNDIAEGASGYEVYARFLQFLAGVRAAAPDCRVYFISASIAPSRLHLQAQYDEANRLISTDAECSGEFTYIDVLPVMHDAAGNLRLDYFGADDLHMNAQGYAAWTPVIREALR